MAGGDLGEGTRLAAATGAWTCFEDEAGQTLRPPEARTWGRRGHTPVVKVSGKGSGRVSIAGLACLKPGEPGRFFYRLRIHRGRKGERRSMSEADYTALVTAAHRILGAPVILIWDNLNTHISKVMRTFTGGHPDWLTVIELPRTSRTVHPLGWITWKVKFLTRTNKSFSPEFKDEAVKMVIETSRPIARVAKELGINEGTLGNWVSAYRRDHAGDEPPLTVSEKARLCELERETRELKMENEFLKKAAAYFASEHR